MLILPILGALVAQLPLLVAYTIGLILALTNRGKYPRAAKFLMLAVALSFTMLALGIFLSLVVPYYSLNSGYFSAQNLGYYTYAVGIISNLGHAAAFGLLLAAIFTGRAPQPGSRNL